VWAASRHLLRLFAHVHAERADLEIGHELVGVFEGETAAVGVTLRLHLPMYRNHVAVLRKPLRILAHNPAGEHREGDAVFDGVIDLGPELEV